MEQCSLLREYDPLRIVTQVDPATLASGIERSIAIHDGLWTIAEELARTASSDVLAIYVKSLNEMIDLRETHLTAGLYARVPETVLLLLFGGSVVALGIVASLVVDLDRPRRGSCRSANSP